MNKDFEFKLGEGFSQLADFSTAEFARQNYPGNIEVIQFKVAALAKPGSLRAEMQGDLALSLPDESCNAEILYDKCIWLQHFIKIQCFFEKLEFMLEYYSVEGNIKFFVESFGYAPCPAQALFIEVAGKSPGAKTLSGQVYGVSAGQAGCFEAGGCAGRSQQFDFFAGSLQSLFPFEQPLEGDAVDISSQAHYYALADRAQQRSLPKSFARCDI